MKNRCAKRSQISKARIRGRVVRVRLGNTSKRGDSYLCRNGEITQLYGARSPALGGWPHSLSPLEPRFDIVRVPRFGIIRHRVAYRGVVTQGYGKIDARNDYVVPAKDVWLKPRLEAELQLIGRHHTTERLRYLYPFKQLHISRLGSWIRATSSLAGEACGITTPLVADR